MAKQSADAWTKYWEASGETTFANGFDQGYDGSFLDFWSAQIDGKNSPVIDLCCGNGALVWIAYELTKNSVPHSEITGFDFADVKPFEVLKRDKADYPGVSFIGNASIEQLPLPDSSVGLAISQYGLEYAGFDKTIPELSRVLKPNARIALIMHSERSEILAKMAPFYKSFSALLGEGQLAEKFLALDDIYNASGTIDRLRESREFKSVIGKINALIYPITNMYMDTFTPLRAPPSTELSDVLISNLFRVFHNRGTKNRARRKDLERQIQKIRTALNRFEYVNSAAVSADQYRVLIQLLEHHRFVIKDTGDMIYAAQNMGWKLVAERSEFAAG